jgi:hypothetical protein
MTARICGVLPFPDRKAALACLLRDTEAGILLNEHVAEHYPTVYKHACRLGAEGIVSKKGRPHVSIRSMPGLDQGSQSCERSGAAGAERELEQVIARCSCDKSQPAEMDSMLI